MIYKFEGVQELVGTMTALDGSGIVDEIYMKVDSLSAKKLSEVLRSHTITRENQYLFFTVLAIKKEHLGLFVKGQSSVVKNGDRYVLTSASRHPLHFKSNLQTLVDGSDGKQYVCAIEIGNIEFDLVDKTPAIDDDTATFVNVSAVICNLRSPTATGAVVNGHSAVHQRSA